MEPRRTWWIWREERTVLVFISSDFLFFSCAVIPSHELNSKDEEHILVVLVAF